MPLVPEHLVGSEQEADCSEGAEETGGQCNQVSEQTAVVG